MAEIHLEKTIDAEPSAIYSALTNQDGLASFWTDQVEATPAQGSNATFGFGPNGSWERFEMRIERLEPDHVVHWHCLDAKDGEWPGTHVRWELERRSDGDGTRLRLHHLGWQSAEDSLPRCAYDWAMIIDRLNTHVTTGERVPYFTEPTE